MNNLPPVITIDGPSGSGKGTLSKKISSILGWHVLDSGVIYRLLALIALNNRIDTNNEIALSNLANTISIDFINKENQFLILFNEKEIAKDVYTEFIGNIASKIAVFPKVREVLLKYQRTFCVFPGLVADGRDMGTIVFPNAILKIFLYASYKERKQRKLRQLQKKHYNNINVDFLKLIKNTIQERDQRDNNRMLSPLLPAVNALILDSTYLSQEEIKIKVLTYIKKKNLLLLPSNVLCKYVHNQG